jgi:PTH1 family peptidyl-tRNA hydrolase
VFLIVGLGNPGQEYQKTRHNIGFMVLDNLAGTEGFSFEENRPFKAHTAKVNLHGQSVLLIKPQTYMNLSGQAVVAAANFYKIPSQNILVICDDLSLEIGTLRLRQKGSSGGQKGLENIITLLGTDNCMRLRLGIGPKPEFIDAKDYVLGKFQKGQEEILNSAVNKACDTIEKLLKENFNSAQQFANTK